MPLPRKVVSESEMIAYRAACAEALALGAVAERDMVTLPLGTKIERLIHGSGCGCVDPKTYTATTPAAWVESCRKRGVVPVVPNAL